MPMLIKHIDAIARQKQSNVLNVVFHPPASGTQDAEEGLSADDFDWKTLPIRQQIIDWLDAQGIGWKHCDHFAHEGLMMG